ncbi:MAG: 2-hydroxyisocaproyl-CoA dehydratase activator [Syntrophomonadaceae bacterium]|nr:2-hydroxyisocaproyl-CoA dehydratase activator [Bacillota bacterium]
MTKKHLAGICVGASNIKIVTGEMENGRFKVIKQIVKPHDGNARKVLNDLLHEHTGPDFLVAVTGRKLREQIPLPQISEPEATELALQYTLADLPIKVAAAASVGGENFMVYELDKKGRVMSVHTGNKCASGTGEFFLQQIRRMNLDPEEAQKLALLDNPYKVASRCSVFSKSDCTHAMNKGVPKGRVVAGLGQMMATKTAELLKKAEARNVLLIGGVAKNRMMRTYLEREGFQITTSAFDNTFEALGAALWAAEHGRPWSDDELSAGNNSAFDFLAPLSSFQHGVSFKEQPWQQATVDDEYIIGLDAGSTTTKAILMRTSDQAIVAGSYLRTGGDPVAASRQCYRSLLEQVPPGLRIIGLGVTGSGRQIVALHGLTNGIVNEIIAHTTAAVYFDPEVDTLFEIGGQDAKYTFIINRVPSDYAMNEACSAGTGSFLEEAAREALNIVTEDIAAYALKGTNPPNFNDQCAAFIGSDIKTAIQEGIKNEDIAAGLVYAICLNYITRVKSSRKVGRKIFMQGGVCYNKAVPLAMAALTGREIIVPPDPGLMGAFGVALEIWQKITAGSLPASNFDLQELAAREVAYGQPFDCAGGKERCDRKCTIARIKVADKTYPFGGTCNKYYNERIQLTHDTAALDLVAKRQRLLFERPLSPVTPNGKTVGISLSLMTNSLYPFYHGFLTSLGFSIVLSDKPDEEGIERRKAPFCYPVELAHGFMANLIAKKPDYILLPHVRATPVKKGCPPSTTCPLIQGEPYVLRRTFQADLKGIELLVPVLDMPESYSESEKEMLLLGSKLGATKAEARAAFLVAIEAQNKFIDDAKAAGKEALERAAATALPTVVLFGRSYNAFSGVAHMGIPHKFASRGIMVVPYDMLDYDQDEPIPDMHWAAGMGILKAAKVAKRQPNLFGCYVTNFSCGPDSFLINYFREIMAEKPSLTLELDSHTADAGIDTRIEAFLDIVRSHDRDNASLGSDNSVFVPAEMSKHGKEWLITSSDGEKFRLTDKRVKLIIPSMGDFSTKAVAAVFSFHGINAMALPPSVEIDLQRGKEYSTCKECLPLIQTMGSLFNYLDKRQPEEMTIYFMPTTGGSCRFAQYNVLTKMLINKHQIPNLVVMSLSSQNGYGGLGTSFTKRALWGVLIGDVMEEIRVAILTLSAKRESGMQTYKQAEEMILTAMASENWDGLQQTLKKAASLLAKIPLHTPLQQAPKIALIGEIYLRRDGFSQRYLAEQMAEKGIVALMAPIMEWVYYTNYLAARGMRGKNTLPQRLKFRGKALLMKKYERIVKQIMKASGLYDYHLIDIDHLINSVSRFIDPRLTGEAILTLACALTEIVDRVDGVISIGPFGCMPSRIAESVIKQTIDTEKLSLCSDPELVKKIMEDHPRLPFLSIESDGSPFPPVIEASLESFVLQTKRLHQTRLKHTKEVL